VKESTIPAAHTYESTTVPPSGTTDGSVTYTCTACGYSYTEVLSSYLTKCTFYPAHCQVKTINDAPINTLPCSVSTSNGSTTLETGLTGTIYTAVGLYLNTSGNYWYEVVTGSGETGYLFSGRTTYVGELTTDITLDSYSYPDAHVKGSAFNAAGSVSAAYNRLDSVNICVHQGFGLAGDLAVNASDSVTGTTYTLDGSTVAKSADFTGLTDGNYTYAICVRYTNYYAPSGKELGTNQGVKYLCGDYFVVIPAAADQTTCSHQYDTTTLTEATCTTNGLAVESCSICGLVVQVTTPPVHTFGDWTVTKEATCTTEGTKTYTCTICGATETSAIPSTGHSYADGSCTVCGETNPDYIPPSDPTVQQDYYLIGYINGADYGCESDWENLGQYKFVNGKLTATFSSDSYVFIKTGDNANWYMTQAYVPGSTGTFISTTEGTAEKMFVPGNVEVTFTLVENADGSLTLSYAEKADTTDVQLHFFKPDTWGSTINAYLWISGAVPGYEAYNTPYRKGTAELLADTADQLLASL
jgi:hypothetical protein